MFHSATGNRATTENDTETRTTTEGSIEGTLVGYMKADVGHSHVKGNVSYVWGAMQEADGKDVNATGDHENQCYAERIVYRDYSKEYSEHAGFA